MVPVQGTDVSVLQGKVPFDALKALGHSFSFIRCKVGNNPGIDTRFVDNVRACRAVEIYSAPYFFPFPLPHLDPIQQANVFVQSAMVDGDAVGTMVGDLPPAFDLEWPPPEEWGKWGCTADQIVDFSIKCLERLRVLYGCAPIVYSYPYFLQAISKAKNFAELTKCRLWIAGGSQYVNGNGEVPRRFDDGTWLDKAPKVVGWGDSWMFWQHDGNGGKKLPSGIDADFNVFRFDLIDLARLAQKADGPLPDLTPDLTTIRAMAMNVMAEDAIHSFRQERAQRILADAA